MPKGSNASKESKSELKSGAERFLAQAITHAQDEGWRTPEDFFRHFKTLDIMTNLEKAPELRATILIQAAGVHEKIARKKSTSSAAEDLRIAFDEGVTTPADVLALLSADDRVRYFDKTKLWAFLIEDQFWTLTPKNDRAIERMTFLLNAALTEHLLTLQAIADGISFEVLSKNLPAKELSKIVLHALKTGRDKKALTEESLLEVVPLRDLVSYLSLENTWKQVIVAKVAQPAGFVVSEGDWDAAAGKSADAKDKGKAPEKAEEKPAAPEELTLDSVSDVKLDDVTAGEDRPAPRRSIPPPKPSRDEAGGTTDDVDALLQSSRPAPEEEARRRVSERLRAINRLPPRHEELTTAILLSIESMYADLLSASTDEARELCIRESFPNEQLLSTALLAMIELLDPSIDVNDPVIKEADADSLIKVVLFEERHRYELAHPSARPPSPSQRPPTPPPIPGPPSRRSVVPPPLPRQGAPLPPPPSDKR